MRSIETVLADVAGRWRQQGLNLLPAASKSALRDFESRFRVQCPEDFAAYLLTIGGMPDGTWDEHLLRFWPLTEIKPVTRVSDAEAYRTYFVFADYSISAHEYAIRLTKAFSNDVVLVGGPLPKTVASTFVCGIAQPITCSNTG